MTDKKADLERMRRQAERLLREERRGIGYTAGFIDRGMKEGFNVSATRPAPRRPEPKDESDD